MYTRVLVDLYSYSKTEGSAVHFTGTKKVFHTIAGYGVQFVMLIIMVRDVNERQRRMKLEIVDRQLGSRWK